MRRLQDEVRIALMKYAFAPLAVMAVICIVWAGDAWQRNVVQRNEDYRDLSVQILTETVADYEERLGEVDGIPADGIHGDAAEQAQFYDAFYSIVNRGEESPSFCLLDEQRQTVLSNEPRFSSYLRGAEVGAWGAVWRMEQSQGDVVEFVQDSDTGQWTLTVGRALRRGDELQGFLVFAMPAEKIRFLTAIPDTHFVLVDRHDYAPIATLRLFRDRYFAKLLPEFRNRQGIVSVEDQDFYMTHADILDGEFTVYAFTPVGDLLAQLKAGAVVLVGLLLIMVPLILVSVRRETHRKMRAAEELVRAFDAVRQGRLDYALSIHTGNEFERIADEYNRMTASLKQLMALNEAEARTNVISELRQLESQFNPHFLFNTLENIKFMVKLDPGAAMEMIKALSMLLRYSINNEVRYVTLRDDLEYLESYLIIQRRRFGGRLQYQQEVAKEALSCKVPKLLVQPVVENAIKYGADGEGNIRIAVFVELAGTLLRVIVHDHGPGIEAGRLEKLRELLERGENNTVHTGVYNIHRRIQLTYGQGYGIQIRCPEEGGTIVELRLPAELERKEDGERC